MFPQRKFSCNLCCSLQFIFYVNSFTILLYNIPSSFLTDSVPSQYTGTFVYLWQPIQTRRRQWHLTPVPLAWKIPWMEEPGRLQSMGSIGVGHDCATSLSLFTLVHCRRKWQPTPVFLPGEFQGQGSLVGCRLQGRTESDTTEAT